MGSHCSKGKRIPVVFDDVYILFVLFPIFVLIVAVAIAVAIAKGANSAPAIFLCTGFPLMKFSILA